MTMSPDKPKSSAGPWGRALLIYVVLAAGVFAFPGGMVSWLDDRNESGWLTAPLAVARAVDAASGAVGVKQAGQSLRRAFANWVGADDS